MKTNTILGLFVAMLAIAAFVPSVSAQFSSSYLVLDDVQIKGIKYLENGVESGKVANMEAGEVVPVWVSFTGTSIEPAEEVVISARILGESRFSEFSKEIIVWENGSYSALLNVALPFDLDEDLIDDATLRISVENDDESVTYDASINVQRSSHELDVLAVEADDRVQAGDNLAIDVVIKNRGYHEAEDTFIRASVPELGISKMLFLGDLASQDPGMDDEDDEFDSEAGRIFLSIPRDAPAGVYNLEVEAFTDDSTTVVTRKVVVLGASEESAVVTSTTTKSFGAGEAMTYTLTVVNAGDSIKVYDLIAESVSGLTVDFDESVVAVPAGSSRTVSMTVTAAEAGTYDFMVNVHSDGELVKTQSYKANVSGRSAVAGDSAVLLTVVLAIIFVVLLVVLIVLLTRKPQKTEELGESYY